MRPASLSLLLMTLLLAAQGHGQGATHTVRRGESVSQIATRYKMTVRELLRLNSLKDANHIEIGQQLKVAANPTQTATQNRSAQGKLSAKAAEEAPVPKAIAVDPSSLSVPKAVALPMAASPAPPPTTPALSAPQTAATPAQAPSAQEAAPQVAEPLTLRGVRCHRIREGETLQSIASAYQSRPGQILTLNRMETHAALRAGQELFIPVPTVPQTNKNEVQRKP